MTNVRKDKRPDPKPRKNPILWQSYLIWDEWVQIRMRHTLRISSIDAGKSNMDAHTEIQYLADIQADAFVKSSRKNMISAGKSLGKVWDWVTSIRGLRDGGLAAQLLAQIDDIGKFDTISKLWRFAGKAVIDGKAEHNCPGVKSHFNGRLKTILYLISKSFITQQTPLYVDIYYAEKERLRNLYPEKIKNGDGKWKYNDGHLDYMAMRKMEKIFLSHLWVKWREYDGLPISMPYVHIILGHTNYIEPAMVE